MNEIDRPQVVNADPAEQYDAIVIGSGMGGLSAASLMARLQGKRVLVLERHFKAGGFTHVFKRKNYVWDVGVHYIGDMAPGSMLREIFDFVTAGGIDWQPMPDPYERFVFPGFSFAYSSQEEKLTADLVERWPEETNGIRAYLVDIRAASLWFARQTTFAPQGGDFRKAAGRLNFQGRGHALVSLKEYLDANFRSPEIKAVLAAQWGDYGQPPSQASFCAHALVAAHYLKGGFFPIGGGEVIADSVRKVVEAAGGAVLLNHQVDEIIVRGGRAVGVRAREIRGRRETEKEFFAPVVISNAGAYNTYVRMLPEEVDVPFREEVRAASANTVTGLSLYVGLREDPRRLGVQGENVWMFSGLDHDENFARRNNIVSGAGEMPCVYASFGSLKDPAFSGGHSSILISFCDYSEFLPWKDTLWKRRGDEYERLKAEISQRLLAVADRSLPGYADLVDYAELATPLTNEHFGGHPGGAIYGLRDLVTTRRFDLNWMKSVTPVENLFLAGADVATPGITGAMLGGVTAAGLALGGRGATTLMKQMRQSARVAVA